MDVRFLNKCKPISRVNDAQQRLLEQRLSIDEFCVAFNWCHRLYPADAGRRGRPDDEASNTSRKRR